MRASCAPMRSDARTPSSGNPPHADVAREPLRFSLEPAAVHHDRAREIGARGVGGAGDDVVALTHIHRRDVSRPGEAVAVEYDDRRLAPAAERGRRAGLPSLGASAPAPTRRACRPSRSRLCERLALLRERHPERGDRDDHEQHELEHRERCRRERRHAPVAARGKVGGYSTDRVSSRPCRALLP